MNFASQGWLSPFVNSCLESLSPDGGASGANVRVVTLKNLHFYLGKNEVPLNYLKYLSMTPKELAENANGPALSVIYSESRPLHQ